MNMVKENESWIKRFMVIWTGQAFSLMGSQLVQFALIWYLTIQTGSATVLAIATMVGILPQIVLQPLAGAYVDRWKRRHVMIAADGLIALCTLALVALFMLGVVEIWHIFLILFARASFSAFHWPASQAATTMLVPEKHLTRVAGLNQSLLGLASILAPPLGAVLIAFLPMSQVLAVDVITAGVAILTLVLIKFPEPAARGGPKQRITVDVKETFHYLKHWRGALLLVGMFMLINLLISPAFSLLPLLVLEHFHGRAIDYATIEAVAGIGMLLGGILLSLWGGTKRRIVTVMASTVLAGIGITLIAFVPSNGFLIALGLMLFVGLMLPILNGSVMAMMQACVPSGLQGRVFALLGALAMAASPIGLAIGGPLADSIGIQPLFLVAGVPTAVMGIIGFLLPSLMRVEEPDSRPRKEVLMGLSTITDVLGPNRPQS